MTATAKKRAGRKPSKNPRNAYLNIRIAPGEFDNLRAHADARGMKYSVLVRQQLGSLLTKPPKRATAPVETTGDAPAPEPTESPAPPTEAAEERTIDLAVWVANRVGLPVALARAHIGNGRIYVAGEVCREVEVPLASVREGVLFDGQPI
jgi:hypothetical protein